MYLIYFGRKIFRETFEPNLGGPLMCLVDEKWTIFGIASYGWLEGCGKPNHPRIDQKFN